jgi:hypothetical protein
MDPVGLFGVEEPCRAVNDEVLTDAEVETVLHRLHGTLRRYLPLAQLAVLSTRLANVLKENAIERLCDIEAVEPYRWRQMRKLGPFSYEELRRIAGEQGVELPVWRTLPAPPQAFFRRVG